MEELLPLLQSAFELVPPVELVPLSARGVNNTTGAVRTGAGEYVWKAYATTRDQLTIAYEHHLLSWLAVHGLSFGVPTPILNRDGQSFLAMDDGWLALFVHLSGEPPNTDDLGHVEAIGAALGELHAALAHYSMEPRPGILPFGDLEHVHPLVPDPFYLYPEHLHLLSTLPYDMLLGWWRDALAELRPFIEGHYLHLPWQTIHSDIVPSNTLISRGRVSAVLDFEFACPDARAIDVASGLIFSMRAGEHPQLWEVVRRFCRGYSRHISMTHDEIAAVPALILLRDAVSAIWWIGRGLAQDDIDLGLSRIQRFQRTSVWLKTHSERLIYEIGKDDA